MCDKCATFVAPLHVLVKLWNDESRRSIISYHHLLGADRAYSLRHLRCSALHRNLDRLCRTIRLRYDDRSPTSQKASQSSIIGKLRQAIRRTFAFVSAYSNHFNPPPISWQNPFADPTFFTRKSDLTTVNIFPKHNYCVTLWLSMRCNRACFALQYRLFCRVKQALLQCKTMGIVMCW